MKKYLPVLILLAIIIPQVTFASWWNPLSWFNNWSFTTQYKNDETKELENRIKELEQKLQDTEVPTTTSLIEKDRQQGDKVPDVPKENKSNPLLNAVPVSRSIPVVPTITPVVNKPADFKGKCILSKEVIKSGDPVRAYIDLMETTSNYNIVWDKKNLTKVIDNNEALFNPVVTGKIQATVTRKSDGYSKVISCTVWVEEEKTEEEIRESSPECKEATSLLKKIKEEMEPIEDKLDEYQDIYLKTGEYNNSAEKSSLQSKLTDLSLRKSSIQSDYYYACKGFVPSSPKIYNTNCTELYGTIHCTTY